MKQSIKKKTNRKHRTRRRNQTWGGLILANNNKSIRDCVYEFLDNSDIEEQQPKISDNKKIYKLKKKENYVSPFFHTDIQKLNKEVDCLLMKLVKFDDNYKEQNFLDEIRIQKSFFLKSYIQRGGQAFCPAIVFSEIYKDKENYYGIVFMVFDYVYIPINDEKKKDFNFFLINFITIEFSLKYNISLHADIDYMYNRVFINKSTDFKNLFTYNFNFLIIDFEFEFTQETEENINNNYKDKDKDYYTISSEINKKILSVKYNDEDLIIFNSVLTTFFENNEKQIENNNISWTAPVASYEIAPVKRVVNLSNKKDNTSIDDQITSYRTSNDYFISTDKTKDDNEYLDDDAKKLYYKNLFKYHQYQDKENLNIYQIELNKLHEIEDNELKKEDVKDYEVKKQVLIELAQDREHVIRCFSEIIFSIDSDFKIDNLQEFENQGSNSCVHYAYSEIKKGKIIIKTINKTDYEPIILQKILEKDSTKNIIPEIYKIYIDESNEKNYIFMQKLENPWINLYYFLIKRNENKEYLNEIKLFIPNLVSAIKTLHVNGFVHHDLKPENMFVNTETNEIKFIDFGFSCMFDNNNCVVPGFTKETGGTPLYMYYVNSKYNDDSFETNKLLDLWSMKIIIQELILGKDAIKKLGSKEKDNYYFSKEEIVKVNEKTKEEIEEVNEKTKKVLIDNEYEEKIGINLFATNLEEI